MNPEMLALYTKLAADIKSLSQGMEIQYLRNAGNWGDSLIRAGFVEFAENFGIRYQDADPQILQTKFGRPGKLLQNIHPGKHQAKHLLIYGGGGGWCQNYGSSLRDIYIAGRLFGKVIVLPSTYEIAPYKHGSHVTFYARDNTVSTKVNPGSDFCPDMAFFLSHKYDEKSIEVVKDTGYFLRTDRESAGKTPIPSSNLDVSKLGNADRPVDEFMRIVGENANIVTDRLHVAIAGAIMNRQVVLIAGNYFKSKAIYDSVLSKYYKNVVMQ